jgi:hypothetical protein
MLEGLKQECNRIYWRRNGSSTWASNQDHRDREPEVVSPALRFEYLTNDGSPEAEQRQEIVDTIIQSTRNGLLTVAKAERMLRALANQWRQEVVAQETEANSRERLEQVLKAAQAVNARLKGQ